MKSAIVVNIIEEIGETEFELMVDSTADVSVREIDSVCVCALLPLENQLSISLVFLKYVTLQDKATFKL